jgi:glycosyltransferase involved in cell wall biosynthesis
MDFSVDVVIPCYKYGKYLKQCVESVVQQASVQCRILIIDDASPDDSAEVAAGLAATYPNVTFRRHISNKGHIATYNEGIEWSSGDFFLLLSADDYLLPGSLERAAQVFAENPGVGMVFGSALVLFENGAIEEVVPLKRTAETRIMSGTEFVAISGSTNIVPTPTAIIRTDLQKRVGGYLPDLPHSGDLEMWIRLATQSQIGFVKEYQAVYRRHTSNMSSIYTDENIMSDFVQRKKAIYAAFKHDVAGHSTQHIKGRAIRDLAAQALYAASAEFNRGRIETSQELQRFAIDTYPNCRQSMPWLRLGFKRAIGFQSWRAINSLRTLFQ